MLGVIGVFGGALLSALHGSWVTSTLLRETDESESIDNGYDFGQAYPTHSYYRQIEFSQLVNLSHHHP